MKKGRFEKHEVVFILDTASSAFGQFGFVKRVETEGVYVLPMGRDRLVGCFDPDNLRKATKAERIRLTARNGIGPI